MNRAAGILMPITSLPGPYGIGCFSREAYRFVDWLRGAGQTFWQILPIHPTSYGDSPYQSFSTFAGNPYFIDLEALIEEGVLTREECDTMDFGLDEDDVDYEAQYRSRRILLTMAYERSNISLDPEYQEFLRNNRWWLDDYALFMALKRVFGGKCWYEWPEDIRLRWDYALDYYRRELYFDIEYQMYLQFKFFQQYRKLKAYANEQGIRIIGDIPIYVAMDSADVWARPELFQLYDVTRIDHFRGFDEYYSIPYGDRTAEHGRWEKGPGVELFRVAEEHLGWHEVIAEDLGFMTDSVRKLVKDSGFPGMKVLEFAFDSRDSGSANDYLPHNYPEHSVAYTGTHDNETLIGWFDSICAEDRVLARNYICDFYTPEEEIHRPMIALAMSSVAKYCIIPMQDYLGLGNEARMNKPSTLGGNWRWRVLPEQLSDALKADILAQTRRYGRENQNINH